MVESERLIVASRDFSTDSGGLTLNILSSSNGSSAFTYEFLDQDGELRESLETFGVDTLQALLFCITAAGDYLKWYEPTASFAEFGVTALLTTNLSTSNEWRAEVRIPGGLL